MLPNDTFCSLIPWDHPVPLRGIRVLYWYSQSFILTGSNEYCYQSAIHIGFGLVTLLFIKCI